METIEKASDTEVRIINVIPEKIEVRVVPLIHIKINRQALVKQISELQSKLDIIDGRISQSQSLGIKDTKVVDAVADQVI